MHRRNAPVSLAELQEIARQQLALLHGCSVEDLDPRATLQPLDDVPQRAVEWLWPGVLPRGKVTIVAGDPGVGKSFAVADIAARVSRGAAWPDERPSPERSDASSFDVGCSTFDARRSAAEDKSEPLLRDGATGRRGSHVEAGVSAAVPMNIERPTSNIERRTQAPAGVLYVAPEIDLGYLVRPRMEMLGADLDRIRVVSTVSPNRIPGDPQGPRPFSVATDLPLLDKAIADDPATALVVIDPLYWMSAGLATTGGRAWRRVLDELSQIAARRNVAIVIVMSLARRGPRRAIHRLAGGLEFAETAGAIWLVVEQRDRPGWRRFVPALNRCAPELPGATAFRIHERGLQWDPRPVSITAEEALAGDGPPAPAPEREVAIDWLTGLLAEGPVSFAEVMALSRRNGIAERTLRRAKSAVEVRTRRVGFGPGSKILWCLPGHDGDWIEDSAGHLVSGGRESPGAVAACSGQPPERSDATSFDVGCSKFDVRRSATERADGSAMRRGVACQTARHEESHASFPVTANTERRTSNIERLPRPARHPAPRTLIPGHHRPIPGQPPPRQKTPKKPRSAPYLATPRAHHVFARRQTTARVAPQSQPHGRVKDEQNDQWVSMRISPNGARFISPGRVSPG